MSDQRRDRSPSLSRPIPKWLTAVIIVVLTGLLISKIMDYREAQYRAFMDEKIRKAKQISECKAMQNGEKRALIVSAGFLAQKTPPDFIRSLVNESIPEVRGIDEQFAAEWIVIHYADLQYDQVSRQFRTYKGATTQP